eukprot:766299-Hanusia_phi.AAC.2
MEPSAEFKVISPHWEEASDDSEFTSTGSLKKVSSQNGERSPNLPPLPPPRAGCFRRSMSVSRVDNSLSLSHCHDDSNSIPEEQAEHQMAEAEAVNEAASKPQQGGTDTSGGSSIKSAPRFCGTGPNGDWEHVQLQERNGGSTSKVRQNRVVVRRQQDHVARSVLEDCSDLEHIVSYAFDCEVVEVREGVREMEWR